MEELLREIRPKYLRPKHFIRMKGAKMSEAEKDEFDTVCVCVCVTSCEQCRVSVVGAKRTPMLTCGVFFLLSMCAGLYGAREKLQREN
jgi:hypothetical protein